MGEHTPQPTPVRAIYGFVLYLTAYLTLGVYLVWAYIPEDWLCSIGLTYWPQKYWAVALPVFVCVSIFFVYIGYLAINFTITLPLDSAFSYTDELCNYEVGQNLEDTPEGRIPPIKDIHISDVCENLYL